MIPGQFVVCIYDGPWDPLPGETVPARGTVYTIRAAIWFPEHQVTGVWLDEIHNPPLRSGQEVTFWSECFRPLRDSSLDVFRQVLETA